MTSNVKTTQKISVTGEFNDLNVSTIRVATIDGEELRGVPHGHCVRATDDITDETDEVKRWASFHHTAEIKAALLLASSGTP